jgi:hypothetical protein
MVIGSAVHLGLSRILKGEDPGNFFEEVVKEEPEVIWKDTPAASKTWAEKMLYEYYERVGKTLNVVATETEILLEVPGVDIPLLGYVDIETSHGIIDVKTTGYFRRAPELNPEWKLQMNIYQMEYPDPGEFHILTRSKTQPVVIPSSKSDPLYVEPPTLTSTMEFVTKVWKEMSWFYETFGKEEEWRGNRTHPWAGKYCPVKNCCQKF